MKRLSLRFFCIIPPRRSLRYVNDGRPEDLAKRSTDDIAKKHHHCRIVDIRPSDSCKRRGVVQHPSVLGGTHGPLVDQVRAC
jgi:hypothetical protein